MSEPVDASRALSLIPPTPRQLRRGVPKPLWIGRVLVLPHMLAGVALPFIAIGLLLWGAFGVPVPVEVTGGGCYTTKNGPSCNIRYRYRYEDQLYRDDQTIQPKDFQRIGPPPSGEGRNRDLKALHFSIGPWVHSGLIGYSSRLVGFLFLGGALFWDALVALIIYTLWIRPAREREMCETGSVARGKVISQRVTRGKGGSRQHARYAFDDEMGVHHEREMQVWTGARPAEVGEEVTVFYSRELPQRSYAYELGSFWIDQMPDPLAKP